MANRTADFLDLKDDFKNPVEKKIADISREVKKSLNGSDDFEAKVKEKIASIVREEFIKTKNDEIDDLAETMAKEFGAKDRTEIKLESKKIRLEIERLEEKYPKEFRNFKKEEFKRKLIDEVKERNPELKTEELNNVSAYGEMVSETYFGENVLDGQKDEALNFNSQYGPGRLENSWTDLKGTMKLLAKKPEEVKEIVQKHDSIKNGLRNVNLPDNLRELRSFENVISSFGNSGNSHLFNKTQKYLGWFDRVDKLTGGWLTKTTGKIGSQATSEFAKNSLGVVAEQGFKQGFSSVLKGIMSGGVRTAATTAATAGGAAAGTAATAAGAAAVSATGVGAIVVAVAAIAKVVKGVADKIAEKIGINAKKFLEENFGKVGGAIIGGAGFLIGLPVFLIGAISVTVMTPIIILALTGLFGYQMFMGNAVASLVPPESEDDSVVSKFDGTYISSSGGIVIPTYGGQAVTGERLVEMASSLINKVCYYYGGGHGHFYPEPVKGIDVNWGKKTYTDGNGVTKTFGNNKQFGSKSDREIYGMDCSGFISWIYGQFDISISGSVETMYYNVKKINASDLKLGDLGFAGDLGHIGMFAGRDSSGDPLWIHSGSGGYLDVCGGQSGFVKIGTYSGFTKYGRVL